MSDEASFSGVEIDGEHGPLICLMVSKAEWQRFKAWEAGQRPPHSVSGARAPCTHPVLLEVYPPKCKDCGEVVEDPGTFQVDAPPNVTPYEIPVTGSAGVTVTDVACSSEATPGVPYDPEARRAKAKQMAQEMGLDDIGKSDASEATQSRKSEGEDRQADRQRTPEPVPEDCPECWGSVPGCTYPVARTNAAPIWDEMREAAKAVADQPPHMKAGINLNPQHFETHAPNIGKPDASEATPSRESWDEDRQQDRQASQVDSKCIASEDYLVARTNEALPDEPIEWYRARILIRQAFDATDVSEAYRLLRAAMIKLETLPGPRPGHPVISGPSAALSSTTRAEDPTSPCPSGSPEETGTTSGASTPMRARAQYSEGSAVPLGPGADVRTSVTPPLADRNPGESAALTCKHREWLDTDEHDASGEHCGAPASWLSCVPFVDAPSCDEHRCRCRKPIPRTTKATVPRESIYAMVGHGTIGKDAHCMLLIGLPHYRCVELTKTLPLAMAQERVADINAALKSEACTDYPRSAAIDTLIGAVDDFDWYQRGDGQWTFELPAHPDCHELHEALTAAVKWQRDARTETALRAAAQALVDETADGWGATAKRLRADLVAALDTKCTE